MTVSLFVVVAIVAIHWVGDFACQTDWMAINKSSSNRALAMHVGTLAAFLTVLCMLFMLTGHATFKGAAFWLGANTLAHFATDYITSRATSKLWFFRRADGIWVQAEYHYPKHGVTIVNPWEFIPGKRHDFFVMIGLDQLLHMVVYFATAALWLQ